MARPRLEGFQKPTDPGKRRPVRLPVITQGEHYAQCSCGAPFTHPREKVRANAIQRHLDKKHGGKGLWM